MRKSMIVLFLAVVFALSACGEQPPAYVDASNYAQRAINVPCETNNAYKASVTIPITPIEDDEMHNGYWKIVDSGENFRIVQLYEDLPWYYRYELIDNNDEIIFYFVTSRGAWIERIREDVIKLSVRAGTNVRWSRFYSTRDNILSDAFQNSELLECGNIAFINSSEDVWKVIVRDIFDADVHFKDFLFDEFAPHAFVTTSTYIACMGGGRIKIDSLGRGDDFETSVVLLCIRDASSLIFELLAIQNQTRKIIVRDSESREIIQEIFPYEYAYFGYPTTRLRVEDMNFDGYVDIGIVQFIPASPNVPYAWWVWDNEIRQFVHCTMLSTITSPVVDRENETIRTNVRIDAARYVVRYYRYVNGELRLINAIYKSG